MVKSEGVNRPEWSAVRSKTSNWKRLRHYWAHLKVKCLIHHRQKWCLYSMTISKGEIREMKAFVKAVKAYVYLTWTGFLKKKFRGPSANGKIAENRKSILNGIRRLTLGFYLGEKHLKERQKENWKSKNLKSWNINLSKNWCWLGGEGFTHPTTRGSYHIIHPFGWPAQPNGLFWCVILRLLLWFLAQSCPLSVPSHIKSLCGHMLDRCLDQKAPQTISLFLVSSRAPLSRQCSAGSRRI